MSGYAAGNDVWWHAGGAWGMVTAKVVEISSSGKRVKIAAKHPEHDLHSLTITRYVKPTTLSHRDSQAQRK
jgi:hypothetical protein